MLSIFGVTVVVYLWYYIYQHRPQDQVLTTIYITIQYLLVIHTRNAFATTASDHSHQSKSSPNGKMTPIEHSIKRYPRRSPTLITR